MRMIVAAVILNLFVAVGLIVVALPVHAAVPYENTLTFMREAKASAKLSASDHHKVGNLQAKAVECCNADYDARSYAS